MYHMAPQEPKAYIEWYDREMTVLMTTVTVFMPSALGAFSPTIGPAPGWWWVIRVLSWLGLLLSVAIYWVIVSSARFDRQQRR